MVQLLWFVQVLLETPQCIQVLKFYSLAAAEFLLSSTVTVSAESVDGPTPAARVIWNTSAPQCVASVRVDFRLLATTSQAGTTVPIVATSTTNSTSQTEVIQTGLKCATNYYVTVVVTGKISDGQRPTLSSRQAQVLVGGKKLCA